MKTTRFILVIAAIMAVGIGLLIWATPAHAGGSNDWSGMNHPTPPIQPVPVKHHPRPAQAQQQSQGQKQGQAQGQQQGQATTVTTEATSEAASDATSDATGGAATVSSSYRDVRQLPMAYAAAIQPTASCKGARTGGATALTFGMTLGGSIEDQNCDLRETARMFAQMGRDDLAIELLCSQALVNKAKISDCAPRPPVVVAPPQPVEPTPDVEQRKKDHGFPSVGK